MKQIYVVEYYSETRENHETKEEYRHIIGVFDTFERGLAYLRKFYEDDRIVQDFPDGFFSQTECKDGKHHAKAVLLCEKDKTVKTERLELYPLEVNEPNDPFVDIMYTWNW